MVGNSMQTARIGLWIVPQCGQPFAWPLQVDHIVWSSNLGPVLKELDHTIHSPGGRNKIVVDNYG